MSNSSLKAALAHEKPLQIVGTINAYTALLAKDAGFTAIYLSGGGVAAASYGLPDLAITNLTDVLQDVYRITDICDLPLLVDIDTGWGSAFNIARAIKLLTKADAAGVHIEDQVGIKRCGHRPKKVLVSKEEMCDRIKAAIDAKTKADFVIMSRTDALSVEGLESTLDRIQAYLEAGAEMIFLEGARNLEDYEAVKKICSVPMLANITEFGVTPLFSKEDLKKAGVELILYPLSAFRAMAYAANETYRVIRETGTQTSLIPMMQTRDQLYEILDYHRYEKTLDALFAKGKI